MARGWGGGRVNCERVDAMFNQELTPPEPRPNFLTYYTATKSSFTLPEITIGQDKIHGWSAHRGCVGHSVGLVINSTRE
jgi:hypothetical protein